MPDTNQPDPTTPSETSVSEENPVSTDTKESIPVASSDPSSMPSEALEALQTNADMPQANNDNLEPAITESQLSEPENPDSTEIIPESSEPLNIPQTQTPQMPANEPFVIEQNPSFLRRLLAKAQESIQFRKRKKLDKIMSMFEIKSKITNDEVEKLLHVSDATATRYLTILKQENKIKQEGKTGKAVFYSKN
ncbi:MAG: hypothetical protein WCC74_02680 [Minisyncoccia bacterium]